MNDTSFSSFIDLVELDQRIAQLSKEAETLTLQIDGLNKHIEQIQAETHNAHTRFHNARKGLDAIELELKSLDELSREKQFRLGLASSPKEFFSLEHEIQAIAKKRTQLDEQGFVIMSELEESQKIYQDIKEQEPVNIDEKRKQLAESESRLAYVATLRKGLLDQFVKDEAVVDSELLATYASMKDKVPNPVVEILKGSCSACFYALSNPDLIEAQQKKLVRCKDCYRLLYQRQYGTSATPAQ